MGEQQVWPGGKRSMGNHGKPWPGACVALSQRKEGRAGSGVGLASLDNVGRRWAIEGDPLVVWCLVLGDLGQGHDG